MNVILACLGIDLALWAWLLIAIRMDSEHAPEPRRGQLVFETEEAA
jgi:hypothetical protein